MVWSKRRGKWLCPTGGTENRASMESSALERKPPRTVDQ
jgi:hypothetical protein